MEKYQEVKYLGKGNFAKVHLMRNRKTQELVAVKLQERAGGAERVKHIAREVMIQRSLHHPNVIELKEVVLTQSHLGIVMEYAPYGDLLGAWYDFDKHFGEDKARNYFQQIILGVEYCHSKGVCHRDLKLENILIGEGDCVKICDFGVSKSENLHSRAKSMVGTPGIIAPEVFLEQEYDGKLADIWSCGTILYEMVVGKSPFNDPEEPENVYKCIIRNKAGSYDIPDDRGLSQDYIDLLARMLVVDPSMRISIQEIKRHPWFLKNANTQSSESVQPVMLSSADNGACSSQSLGQIAKILNEAKNKGEATIYCGKRSNLIKPVKINKQTILT